jgi:hypothetical protein
VDGERWTVQETGAGWLNFFLMAKFWTVQLRGLLLSRESRFFLEIPLQAARNFFRVSGLLPMTASAKPRLMV